MSKAGSIWQCPNSATGPDSTDEKPLFFLGSGLRGSGYGRPGSPYGSNRQTLSSALVTERRSCAPGPQRETDSYERHHLSNSSSKKVRAQMGKSLAGELPVRRSRPEGTDTCACGYTVTAPVNSQYSLHIVTNKWHCSKCNARWTTEASIRCG